MDLARLKKIVTWDKGGGSMDIYGIDQFGRGRSLGLGAFPQKIRTAVVGVEDFVLFDGWVYVLIRFWWRRWWIFFVPISNPSIP